MSHLQFRFINQIIITHLAIQSCKILKYRLKKIVNLTSNKKLQNSYCYTKNLKFCLEIHSFRRTASTRYWNRYWYLGRVVALWKRGCLTTWKPGFHPRPGVLFGCEEFAVSLLHAEAGSSHQSRGKKSACLSVHMDPHLGTLSRPVSERLPRR